MNRSKIVIVVLGIIVIVGLIFYFNPIRSIAKDLPKQKQEQKQEPITFIQYANTYSTCAVSTNDQDGSYKTIGARLKDGGIDYKFNTSTFSKNLSKGTVMNAINSSFATIQGANDGILFHNAGETIIRREAKDDQNIIAFKSLASNIAAITYLWVDNNRITNVDTFFNNKIRWSFTNFTEQNDCGGTRGVYDLRDIATHEFGHWVGLDDLYTIASKDLTMYGYAARGELKKDSLGLGDINGIRANWP